MDGGVSGAYALRLPAGDWKVHPVVVGRNRGHRVLDVFGNLRLLQSFAEDAGGIHRLFVVYERAGQNRVFGFRNAFINGRNDEFWRVLLEREEFRFTSVDPKTWQAGCGIFGRKSEDTKLLALKFVRQNCGDVDWLDNYTKAQQTGIVDAMCMAIWAERLQAQLPAPDVPPEGGSPGALA
jgi:hypothetical protein